MRLDLLPIKYEIHKASGALIVDRFLYTAMRYTLSEDGDPCDVVITNQRGLLPGSVIAVPAPRLSRRYEHVSEYTDLPEITRQQIQHFFEHYKDLEPGKWVKVAGWGNAAEARRLIREGIARCAADQE